MISAAWLARLTVCTVVCAGSDVSQQNTCGVQGSSQVQCGGVNQSTTVIFTIEKRCAYGAAIKISNGDGSETFSVAIDAVDPNASEFDDFYDFPLQTTLYTEGIYNISTGLLLRLPGENVSIADAQDISTVLRSTVSVGKHSCQVIYPMPLMVLSSWAVNGYLQSMAALIFLPMAWVLSL